jgi:hypothetical protein
MVLGLEGWKIGVAECGESFQLANAEKRKLEAYATLNQRALVGIGVTKSENLAKEDFLIIDVNIGCRYSVSC